VALAARRTPLALALLAAIALLFARDGADWVRGYGGGDTAHEAFSPAAEREVAAYIAAHSPTGAGILVWALAPGIYALADRHPVTRYPFHRLLLTDAPLAREVPGRDERRAELLAQIAVDPPVFVVLGNHDANPFEPDSITSLLGFPALATIVERDYHEVMKTGHFVVLERNPAPR